MERLDRPLPRIMIQEIAKHNLTSAGVKHLVKLLDDENPRIVQNVGWCLMMIANEQPELLNAHLPAMMHSINNSNNHPSVRRNLLRAVQDMDVPQKHAGILADLCFKYLADHAEAIAVRCNAMSILGNLCVREPELKQELILIIREGLICNSPAYHARARDVLKLLKRL